MARIFTEGAEMGDTVFWNAGNILSSQTYVRSGAYSYYCASGDGYKDIPSLNEIYFRFGYFFRDASGVGNFMLFQGSGATLDSLYVNGSTGKFSIYSGDGGSLLASGTHQFLASVWHLVEIYLKIGDAPNGRYILKVDGITECDYTGDTQPAAVTNIDRIYIRVVSNLFQYYDDLALNSTDNSDGKNDNSWCGDGRIYKILPSGSSATTNNWVNSDGTSGSYNWQYVDEIPADSDTTYVYCSGSNVGTQDQYAMTNLGLTPTTQIYRVWTEARAKKTDTSDTYIKLGFLPNGGTDSMSGSIPLTMAYTPISGCSLKLNPYTSASWTNADLDGLEAVIEMA